MLLGEQGGRHQHGYLPAAVHRDEGGAHRHFGLAEADVAADQAVHWLVGEHVGEHCFDGGLLVRRLLEGEAGGEGDVVGLRVLERVALARRSAGVDVEQFGGDVADLFGGLALGFLPDLGAQPVQRRQRVVGAGVAGDQVQAGHRHVELGFLGVFEHEEFGGLALDFQGDQAVVAADAVVDVHHRRAFAQLGEVLDHVVAGVALLLAAAALHHALAEQRAFGDQRDARLAAIGMQQQTFVHRRDGDRQAVGVLQELRPALDFDGAQLQACQQFQHYFAAAGGFGGEEDAAVELLDELAQAGQRFGRLGFDGQLR
ncbi:hypothetical protein D3C78_739490 [compost metagenome]